MQEETVYGIIHIGPYEELGAAFNTMWQWVVDNELQARTRSFLGIYYCNPCVTPAAECRSAACIGFDAPLTEPLNDERVQTIKLEAGRYARYRHVGPYAQLGEAYDNVYGKWLPTSGYECRELPPFEVYLNHPDETPESELITDIYVALKA